MNNTLPATKHSTILLVEGIFLFILGLIGITAPYYFTFSLTLFLGSLLFVSGVIQLFQCIVAPSAPAFLHALLLGIASVILGILFLTNPVGGALTLTLLLTIYFFWDGLVKLFTAFQFRKGRSTPLLIFSGLVDLALGALIWSGWPGTAAWVIGLLVGINLLFHGLYLIVLSRQINQPV